MGSSQGDFLIPFIRISKGPLSNQIQFSWSTRNPTLILDWTRRWRDRAIVRHTERQTDRQTDTERDR